MKKKLISAVAVVMLLTVLFTTFASAAENTIQPRYTNVRELSVTLIFDGEQGYVDSLVDAVSGVTKIDATVTLYKKNFFGFWVETGYSWDYSVSDNMLSAYEAFDADSGKQYKAVISASVLKGTWEDVETTDIKECP